MNQHERLHTNLLERCTSRIKRSLPVFCEPILFFNTKLRLIETPQPRLKLDGIWLKTFIWIMLSILHANGKIVPNGKNSEKASNILSLIGWLGEQPDYSDVGIIIKHLNLQSRSNYQNNVINSSKIPNITEILDNTPLPENPKILMSYEIYSRSGKAASELSGASIIILAHIRLHFLDDEICLRESDVTRKYGAPVASQMISDGGGKAVRWTTRKFGVRENYISSSYLTAGDCGRSILISQEEHSDGFK